MKIAIIGAGVVGLTTAHYLQQAGASVHVYEREGEVAAQTSKANGAQLSYSFTDAMASPDLIPKLGKIMLGQDPGLSARPSLSPEFLRWGLSFLANCRPSKARKNSLKLLSLALNSAELMQEFHDDFGAEYNFRRAGKIVLLQSVPSVSAKQFLQEKNTLGSDAQHISFAEACALEPALETWQYKAPAAVYSANDEVACARLFAQQLKTKLQARGVIIRCGLPVLSVLPNKQGGIQRGQNVETAHGSDHFDAVVLCTGLRPGNLLTPLKVRPAIYPVTGYSVTLPSVASSNRVSITALHKKIVFSRMADNVRIAGFADINAKASQQDQRIKDLLQTAKALAPGAADFTVTDVKAWRGKRPMTPDSLPIVGSSGIPGLYLNMGHGMLGWTLCAATGYKVAQQVVGDLG